VLLAAADRAGWGDRRDRAGDVGFGIGYARYKEKGAYCAVVAEVEAVSDIRLRRLTVAADVGRVINPDGVRNQLEGGAVQSASWTFSEVPTVDVVLVDHPDLPSLGSGEASQGPAAGAIGNAVADAVGVRVRDLPITTEQVVRAMEQTGTD
jgi:CO/xanthine dehydrogenase Mo-binding subunit